MTPVLVGACLPHMTPGPPHNVLGAHLPPSAAARTNNARLHVVGLPW